jgi:hypothetical protein
MTDQLNEYMTNPKAFIIKKWIGQVIGTKAPEHFDIIERCARSLVTQKDLEDFSKLIGSVYEAGFYKAANDYKRELVKHNIKVNVDTETIA